MKDILIIATQRALVQKTEKIIGDEGIDRIDIFWGQSTKRVLKFVSEELSEATEVILTMPGMASLIESTVQNKLPILTIEYNNIDIIKGLRNALSLCPGSVALAHYKEENPRIQDIKEMVGEQFINFLFGEDDSTNQKILRSLKGRGVIAIVGGGYICNLAKDEGFSVFPLEINLTTLRKTILRAVSIANTRKFTRNVNYDTNLILRQFSDAVVVVNNDNKVTFFNNSAEIMFRRSAKTVIGKNPRIFLNDNYFDNVLLNKESIENIMHESQKIIGDYSILSINGILSGCVGSFRSLEKIKKIEEVYRRPSSEEEDGARYSFDDFLGDSPRFRALKEQARCFALTDETVLITGESGTGKEVMASSIHNASRRKKGPFLAINCAAIPETLMESELFGYEPGTFTGGRKNGASGLFESAQGGTLFLDEIGELPLQLQGKLLRVLQTRRVRRLGAVFESFVDVRIIAATNKNLKQEVDEHRFRSDLYYRLNIFHVHMLPLRDYADQLGDIVEKLLVKKAPGSSASDKKRLCSLLDHLSSYSWPGNMRELENVVRRYVALSQYLKRPITLGDIFNMSDFHERCVEPLVSREERERQELLETFDRLHGNRSLIARELGISRTTLWRKLRNLNG